jgi:hypothetical protein
MAVAEKKSTGEMGKKKIGGVLLRFVSGYGHRSANER